MGLAEEARWKAKFDHGAAQEALAATGEACKKVEEENSHLAEEKLALVIELGAVKDDFADFREKAAADREIMKHEFDSSGDTLFNYGYGCCTFAHNICGSKPEIPDGMPNPSVPLTAEFFSNPRCPSGASAAASSLDPVVLAEKTVRRKARLLPERRLFFHRIERRHFFLRIPRLNRVLIFCRVRGLF